VIGTAILGAALLRTQGISTLAKVQKNINRGQLPATELIEGLILLISGVLLLTPGFFTDMFGFLALVPILRQRLAQILLRVSIGILIRNKAYKKICYTKKY
jgi:UPF0716 protein FxsA